MSQPRVIRLRISRCRIPIGVQGVCERFRPKTVVNLAIPVLPLPVSTQTKARTKHIWHTIRRQKTNLRGVLVVLLLMKQISVAFSNHPAEVPRSVPRRCFEQRSSDLVRAESRTLFIFQALGLQLHFANQARHRTCSPVLLRKGTAVGAFREFGNECGFVAVSLIL
jgi:hypothetical protein